MGTATTFINPNIPFTTTPTTSTTNMVHSSSIMNNTLLNMPIPGSRLAPEKYKGDYSRIRTFISHYELLCDYNNVISGTDKCETIIRYCSTRVRQVILGLPSYTQRDWKSLKEDLLQLYDAERDTKRYRVRDLIKFVKQSKNKSIRDLIKWKKYVRNFIMIAGWLLEQKKISERIHATYFWSGIPRVLRNRLEGRMLAKNPTRDLTDPFSFEETSKAAEALFQRDRFDENLLETDDEDGRDPLGEDSEDSEEDSDSDSENSDGDDHYHKSYRNRRHRKQRKLSRDSDEDDMRRVQAPRNDITHGREINKKDEVESLIKQMNGMHVGDPQYAMVYWRAIKKDGDVRLIVPPPETRQHHVPPSYPNTSRMSHYPPTRPPPPTFPHRSRPPFQYQGPPHQPNAYPVSPTRGSNPTQQGPARGANAMPHPTASGYIQGPIECYGCRERGHTIPQCPRIQEYIQQNYLARQPNGRLTRADGSGIQRLNNETIVEAIDRERRNQIHANFVSIDEQSSEDEGYEGRHEEVDEESDHEDELENEADMYLAVPNFIQIDQDGCPVNGIEVYPVERQAKSTTVARREIMDGVVIPARRKTHAHVPETLHKGPTTRSQARAQPPANDQAPPRPTRAPAPRPAKPLPVTLPSSIQNHSKTVDKENIRWSRGVEERGKLRKENEMNEDKKREEKSMEEEKLRVDDEAPKGNVNPFTNRLQPPHRQSAVSAQVAPISVLNQILNSKINVAIGELLGVSKEVTGLLTDSLKLKPSKFFESGPSAVATAYRTDTRGLLIKLKMDCDGIPLTAIIDTGSQLNIVSQEACNTKIRRAIDRRSKVVMNDANGGGRSLEGLVENVPLNCGGLLTSASLHVGSHVPFELLLGRPWQRGNYVSIDERSDGTYLLFKDPEDMEERYEILVQPDDQSHRFPFNPSLYVNSSLAEDLSGVYFTTLLGTEQSESGKMKNCYSHEGIVIPTLIDKNTSGPDQPTNSGVIGPIEISEFNRQAYACAFSLKWSENQLARTVKLTETENDRNGREIPINRGELDNKYSPIPSVQKPTQTFNKSNQICKMSYQFRSVIRETPMAAIEEPDGSARASANLISTQAVPVRRTTPELLLIGIGDIGHLQRTGQSHEMILSSKNCINLGASADELGFARQRILALQCAVLPEPNQPTRGPVARYGCAEIIFYEGLGGTPPPGWTFPYGPTTDRDENPRTIPVSVNGRIIGHSSHVPRNQTRITETEDTRLPPYSLDHPMHPSPTAPVPLASSTPNSPDLRPLDLLRQLLDARQGNEKSSREPGPAPASPDRNLSTVAPPTQSPTRNAHAPYTAISPTGAIAPSTVSCSAIEGSRLTTPDSLPDLLYPDEAGYTSSSEEMDWEGGEEERKGEESSVSSDHLNEQKAQEHVEAARTLASMKTDSRSLVTHPLLRTQGMTSSALNELSRKKGIVILTLNSSDRMDTISEHTTEENPTAMVAAGDSITPRVRAVRTVKKPTILTLHSSPTTTSSSQPATPRIFPRNVLRPILRENHDIQVYSVTIPPYDPALIAGHLERIAQRKRQIPPVEESSTENIASSSPPPVSSNDSAASPSISTEPNSTDEEGELPRDILWRTRRGQDKYWTEKLIKAQNRAAKGTPEQWTILPAAADVNTYPTPSLRSATKAPGLAVRNSDKVLQHEPRLPVYPTPLANRYAEDNLNAPVGRDLQHEEHGNLQPDTSGPTHIIPTPIPTTDDLSQPPPPLPLSHSFRQHARARIPKIDQRTIPIQHRSYHGCGDFEYSRPVARVKGYLNVDIRTLQILSTTEGIPAYCISRFTILGGILEPYVFPRSIDRTPAEMAEIPPYRASNWEGRLAELHNARHEVRLLVDDVVRCLTVEQHAECSRDSISVFRLRHGRLIPTETNRASFFSRLHPAYNAAITSGEESFLRSAIYMLRETPAYAALADTADVLLRTANYDSWLISELISMGCLGSPERDEEALAFIEATENEKLTELYDEVKLYQRDGARSKAAREAEEKCGTKRGRLESSDEDESN